MKIKTLSLSALMIMLFVQLNAQTEVKPALLVMDIQNQFLPMMDQEEQELALQYINAYIELFRQSELPVIQIYHTDDTYGPHPDSVSFRFPESIKIQPDDPKIIKNYPSAFTKTDLHQVLQREGCNTLFICGLSATGCVLATYMAASDFDYEAFLIKNAIISHNAEYTDQIEEIFGAVNYSIVKVLLQGIH